MSWADERARLLAPAPVKIPPFTPSLPHFVTNGHGGWVLTPYALAHCAFCGAELVEGEAGECATCRQKIDATVMPWDKENRP